MKRRLANERSVTRTYVRSVRHRPFLQCRTTLVPVQNAEEEDIEDLFSRLNNGEPLNAAEKRNAMGGTMCNLIREVSDETFFQQKLAFTNRRYQYYEVAAKLLLIEKTEAGGGDPFCDLKKRYLDRMVEENHQMAAVTQAELPDT